ncbi:MAG: methyltransferase domain-containing protein [Bradyrhizobiaceae bacterium]|nr:methyltransferase domain-containing protein [Bradyrhizobiaceae bacterium]
MVANLALARQSAPTPAPAPVAAPDFAAIKTRQQATWSSGDYAVIGTTLQIIGESLCEALDLRANQRVLDVAAGNGNVSLAAARRFADVTASDYVPALLERAKERAFADRLPITFEVADAENLPFPDGSFDVVASSLGAMFTPDHARTASEMLRVCRSGGKIGLASWTPDGFIGELFKTIGRHVPPPAGLKSPALWGTRSHLIELFGPASADIAVQTREFTFRYRSPEHWIEVFRTKYGPVLKAFDALDAAGKASLAADLEALIARFNRATDGTMVAPAVYLETVIVKR